MPNKNSIKIIILSTNRYFKINNLIINIYNIFLSHDTH